MGCRPLLLSVLKFIFALDQIGSPVLFFKNHLRKGESFINEALKRSSVSLSIQQMFVHDLVVPGLLYA